MRTVIEIDPARPGVVCARWSGRPSRDCYRRAVQACSEAMRANRADRLELDMREVRADTIPALDKFFLGCVLVALVGDGRCAVLLHKEHITGVLARVGADAGVQLQTFFRTEAARAWLDAPPGPG